MKVFTVNLPNITPPLPTKGRDAVIDYFKDWKSVGSGRWGRAARSNRNRRKVQFRLHFRRQRPNGHERRRDYKHGDWISLGSASLKTRAFLCDLRCNSGDHMKMEQQEKDSESQEQNEPTPRLATL
jgi:hypothetical protein